MTETIAGAVRNVTDRIAAAAIRSGRDPSAVTIVAAVKQARPGGIEEAISAGITDLGANRAKDLWEKSEAFPEARWHYIGSIQSNKARFLTRAHLIHSLDRVREAEVLDPDHEWDVLIEVNLAGESSKEGVAPDEIEGLLEGLGPYQHVRPRGFMFVAPQVENPEDVRWVYAQGRALRERFERFGLEELSMGMTDDFEVAVEEGATIVRIGRAIFRPTSRDE